MRKAIYISILLIGLFGCKNETAEFKIENNTKSKVQSETDIEINSKHHTKSDTVYISTEIGETLKFDKASFNRIVTNHPEFFTEYPNNPDQLHFNGNDKEEFGSEVGQDIYYVLYAYFLKQRNGEQEYQFQRNKLIDIYSKINSIFGYLQYGGTYFGHQKSRILGYAEYSIFLLPKTEKDISKTYDIKEQKELYIKSLRKLIEDESSIDFYSLGEEKKVRTKKLNEFVTELDNLITDIFYLRRAQEFQYGHYEYY